MLRLFCFGRSVHPLPSLLYSCCRKSYLSLGVWRSFDRDFQGYTAEKQYYENSLNINITYKHFHAKIPLRPCQIRMLCRVFRNEAIPRQGDKPVKTNDGPVHSINANEPSTTTKQSVQTNRCRQQRQEKSFIRKLRNLIGLAFVEIPKVISSNEIMQIFYCFVLDISTAIDQISNSIGSSSFCHIKTGGIFSSPILR